MADLQIRETGIILAHGNNASEYKGKLLTDIAAYLAVQGQPTSSSRPCLWESDVSKFAGHAPRIWEAQHSGGKEGGRFVARDRPGISDNDVLMSSTRAP